MELLRYTLAYSYIIILILFLCPFCTRVAHSSLPQSLYLIIPLSQESPSLPPSLRLYPSLPLCLRLLPSQEAAGRAFIIRRANRMFPPKCMVLLKKCLRGRASRRRRAASDGAGALQSPDPAGAPPPAVMQGHYPTPARARDEDTEDDCEEVVVPASSRLRVRKAR